MISPFASFSCCLSSSRFSRGMLACIPRAPDTNLRAATADVSGLALYGWRNSTTKKPMDVAFSIFLIIYLIIAMEMIHILKHPCYQGFFCLNTCTIKDMYLLQCVCMCGWVFLGLNYKKKLLQGQFINSSVDISCMIHTSSLFRLQLRLFWCLWKLSNFEKRTHCAKSITSWNKMLINPEMVLYKIIHLCWFQQWLN